ncbi:hypothetical protein [Streptacidiphilus fuscans]|uniref:Uncharacterized protein n=1 Tax=Streptacidiphilus fuscans TaxID=2789292 RepID=A0A931FJE0_9ACTN|nr:hypothetical protein [Streptacidiphilus fuscans]MBF9072664.1 hypothetical protein [Streptacidiphilus fuscans]
MGEEGPGPALGGEVCGVPAQMVSGASQRLGPGDVAVLVVGVLLALLGSAANGLLTLSGGLAVSLGGMCRANSGGVGCSYLWVWLYGPCVGLALAVAVGIDVGRRRRARGRGTWPVLPLGLVLYLPIVAAAFWALS